MMGIGGTLIDYIRREAFPKVVKTRVRECGCVYKTMDNGGVWLTYCPKHLPKPELSKTDK
jgi:hypothetical protein